MQAVTRTDIQHHNAYPDCWSVIDDDMPKPPEVSPLDSAQFRRWAKEQQKTRA